jgi:uncharacterized membrane protein
MAGKKISDFTAVTTLAAADLLEVETAAGNSRKITAQNAANALMGLSMRGALVKKSADQTTANYSGGVLITWDAETYDTDGIHDNVTNPSRLTVPAGVSWVRLIGQIDTSLVTAGSDTYIYMTKNGSTAFAGTPQLSLDLVSITTPRGQIQTPPLQVSPGDYFEFGINCADTSITVVAASSWFCMEILG